MVKVQNIETKLYKALLNMSAVESAKSRRQLDLTEFNLNRKSAPLFYDSFSLKKYKD